LLTEQAKLVARLVKKLIEPSRVEPSYERVEPAHKFSAHGLALRAALLWISPRVAMGEDLPTGRDSSATTGRIASSRAQLLPPARVYGRYLGSEKDEILGE
jgi:hypothetical protein